MVSSGKKILKKFYKNKNFPLGEFLFNGQISKFFQLCSYLYVKCNFLEKKKLKFPKKIPIGKFP